MTSWAYRATPSGANFSDTVVLLTQYAFLWRPLFKDTTQRSGTGYPPTYAYLGAINPDADRLFVYFSQQGVLTYVGGYAFAPMRPRARSCRRRAGGCEGVSKRSSRAGAPTRTRLPSGHLSRGLHRLRPCAPRRWRDAARSTSVRWPVRRGKVSASDRSTACGPRSLPTIRIPLGAGPTNARTIGHVLRSRLEWRLSRWRQGLGAPSSIRPSTSFDLLAGRGRVNRR